MDTGSKSKNARRKRRSRRVVRGLRRGTVPLLAFLLVVAVAWLWAETHYSELQAQLFSGIAQRLSFRVEPGINQDLWLPQSGPYDIRLGYSRMKETLPHLVSSGYGIDAQARQSVVFRGVTQLGLYPIYREKSQAGLALLDRRGEPLYVSRHPERQYAQFDSIPPLLVATLLYVENRELLAEGRPSYNPALEWERLSLALLTQAARSINGDIGRIGGSTLATQLEKFRHSPGGRSRDASDKLRQMLSASLRAYNDGDRTLESRRRIVVDFINSVPLGAVPGYGEVIGLGDGLWTWYGRDFEESNRLLQDVEADPRTAAQAYKEALSLVIAQRRPSELLGERPDRLADLTDRYLRVLARDGVIAPALKDAALAVALAPRQDPLPPPSASFIERKAVNSMRAGLANLLDVESLYALDRYDLTASTTLDGPTQAAATGFLTRLADDSFLRRNGFKAEHLLARGDPREVLYSFTLYEASPLGNLLRVQADNLDQPLDINVGAKLDLGSSAKLRTVITYLEAIAELHARYSALSREALAGIATQPDDRLSRWALDYLIANADRSLARMLDAAMQRRYSASPAAVFFTGGGRHTFSNFKREDDARVPTVAEAFEQSINLAFIRLMRDLVHYHAYEAADAPGRDLREGDDHARQRFLERFTDHDRREFLLHFWRKYHGKTPEELLPAIAASVRPAPSRLAVVFRSVEPEADFAAFAAFMRDRLGKRAGTEANLKHLYASYTPERFDLADRGYLARVHPLELWLVAYLKAHPQAGFADALSASAAEAPVVYRWLYNNKSRRARDLRIGIALEAAAFDRITAAWQRLGYPFERLVPSLATAIGVSADRPASLAKLMGVLVNGGVLRPQVSIKALHFAADTPFETLLSRDAHEGARVLQAEVADVVRRALLGVVDNGTARRLKGVFRGATEFLPVGGKTGTGDHRYDTFGPGGAVISSRVVNRAATFAFFIDDRFFGTVTAFVPGARAANYDFTSSLPVQILKAMEPILRPIVSARNPGESKEELPLSTDSGNSGLRPTASHISLAASSLLQRNER
ncbi:MAG: transglycosylase domain-containing protein [Betaproteobacteria bacterium]|nr:transglycosylase domain-containing protein [Betaproteobacteria bacterium]